ncbi:monooxygenase 1-like [Humulus lupulus]|uniref:monooxygenase 1-like n=1 Tax=Humulus lupulus TaxID=3486 RepID=UPI002B41100E|nr:monooxygenase 1-like [Humulus lupulus]
MDKEENICDIVIVGAGICGLSTALALHRKGIKSVVLERAETIKAKGAGIIVHSNGWRALDQLGIASNLRKTAILVQSGQYITINSGVRKNLAIGKGELRCLKRADVIRSLAESLPPQTLRFNSQVCSVELNPFTSHPIIQLQDGTRLNPKVVIGCDGVKSLISNDTFGQNYTKYLSTSVVRGFTNYEYSHGFGNKFVVMSDGKAQLGRMPVTHNLVYWFVTRKCTIPPSSQSSTRDHYDSPAEIKESTLRTMKGFPKEVVEMISKSVLSSLHLTDIIKYRAPWSLLGIGTRFRRGTVTVAGDAMHAMGPFLAQGGSAALEDAVVLARCLAPKLYEYYYCSSSSSPSPHPHLIRSNTKMVEEAFDEYLKERKKRVFKLCMESYLVGLMVDTPSSLLKFLAGIAMALLFPDPFAHSSYDCGRL